MADFPIVDVWFQRVNVRRARQDEVPLFVDRENRKA